MEERVTAKYEREELVSGMQRSYANTKKKTQQENIMRQLFPPIRSTLVNKRLENSST